MCWSINNTFENSRFPFKFAHTELVSWVSTKLQLLILNCVNGQFCTILLIEMKNLRLDKTLKWNVSMLVTQSYWNGAHGLARVSCQGSVALSHGIEFKPIVRVTRVKMAGVSICPIHVHCQSRLLPERILAMMRFSVAHTITVVTTVCWWNCKGRRTWHSQTLLPCVFPWCASRTSLW